MTDEAVNDYSLLTQVEKAGEWNVEAKKKIVEAEIGPKKTISFCLGLNLDNVPAYAKDIAYLQNNLQVTTEGCTASITVQPKSSVDPEKIKGKLQNDLFRDATHLVVVSVSKMNVNNASVSLRLPVKYDMWYEDWSTEDDKRAVSQSPAKTFAFKYLINGVKEAYETRTKNYIDLSIPISK